jgi:hypothetical protein
MFSLIHASAAVCLTEVFFELAIYSDEFLSDEFVLPAGLFNLDFEIIVTGLLVLIESTCVLEQSFIQFLGLISRTFKSLLEVFKRIDLNCVVEVGLRIVLHGTDPALELRFASDLSIILIQRGHFIWDS